MSKFSTILILFLSSVNIYSQGVLKGINEGKSKEFSFAVGFTPTKMRSAYVFNRKMNLRNGYISIKYNNIVVPISYGFGLLDNNKSEEVRYQKANFYSLGLQYNINIIEQFDFYVGVAFFNVNSYEKNYSVFEGEFYEDYIYNEYESKSNNNYIIPYLSKTFSFLTKHNFGMNMKLGYRILISNENVDESNYLPGVGLRKLIFSDDYIQLNLAPIQISIGLQYKLIKIKK